MAYSAPTAHCAVGAETLMLQVRFAHPPNPAPSYRFFVLFSKTHDLQVRFALPPNPAPLSRFFVLFSKTHDLQVRFALPPSPRRNLLSEGSGVLHGLFCDSAPSPIRALVFRSAYSASRNARPPAASRPPNPAPSSRFFSISRRSRLRGCRHRAESTHHLTPSGCVPSGGAVAPPAPPLPPPSRCRPDRFKGSP